jgi:NmrA-like family
MAAPVVAIVGGTGYVGKLVIPWLLDAVEKGRIKEVRVLSRRPAQIKGAKTYVVNYDDEKSLDKALSGANVLLSTSPQIPLLPPPARVSVDCADLDLGAMGLQGDDFTKNKEALVDAAARNKVSVYIPSEFGTYYYITNYPHHPIFELKAHHFEEAKKKIPKVTAIFTSLMMEQSLFKGLGFDNEKEIWSIVGPGDVPVSLTANDDVGRFTAEACIMAYQEPEKVPDKLVVYSSTMTFQEYAAILDKHATTGHKLKIQGKSLPQAKQDWEDMKHTVPIYMVALHAPRPSVKISWDFMVVLTFGRSARFC